MQTDRTGRVALSRGNHALLLAVVFIAQIASGAGVLFLLLLLHPTWFRRRSDRVVIGTGAALGTFVLVAMVIDLVAGPQVGYQFG